MPQRYDQKIQDHGKTDFKPRPRLFFAVKEKLQEGYHFSDFKSDLMSSLVVTMVAVPLSMALAIASGVAPQHGLYTAIIGGIIVSLLGGSRFQVTGPTAAFVVILFPIADQYGLGGLLTAGFTSGLILWLMGIGRMGKLIQFIPYPVMMGFTSGIAVVIAILQLKDFFGLQISSMPIHFPEKVWVIFTSFSTVTWVDTCLGLLTLFLLLLWPRINKKIPGPLVVLSFVSFVGVLLKLKIPDLPTTTIGTKFSYTVGNFVGHGIPSTLPHISWPWMHEADSFKLTYQTFKDLIPSAFAIAMLGAIESLLSAVIADGMARTKHHPDVELKALGIANMICPFFGGIAATGAIARTATNIRYGAKSPFSSALHGVFILLTILAFAPLVSYIPMAALSALLMLVAYNMFEAKHFLHILKVGPKSVVTVLLICFFLTIIFDMVIGVTAGIVLASLLFMNRMAAFTSSQIVSPAQPISPSHIPPEVLLYDINGPLFFGAAEKAMSEMDTIQHHVKTVFLLMEDVPVMDLTGLVALESAVKNLIQHNRKIYLIGVKSQPKELMLKSDLIGKAQQLFFCSTIEAAISHLQSS